MMATSQLVVRSLGIAILLLPAVPQIALSGEFGPEPTQCYSYSNDPINGTFTNTTAKYSRRGYCLSQDTKDTVIQYPTTTQGSFSNGSAKEVFEIPQGAFNQPSHFYGKWVTTFSCPSDPWLTGVTCTVTNVNDSFSEHDPGYILKNIDRGRRRGLPLSVPVIPAERNALIAQRNLQLAEQDNAEKKSNRRAAQRLQGATQPPTPHRTVLSPIIHAPTAGQRFLNQTTVPIRLGPPPQWADTNIGIDGGPIKTAESVTGYMVRIERKDPMGNWVAQTTLPVGAIQAESAAGYTGFGAGAPPGGITTPGAWRMSAQVSSPRPSGWSEWVEFVVMPPATNKALQPPKRSFGK
ncbi:MAG: hypothetical protein OEW33_02570 [Nitrospirota bacterium]|nr:hypothetical protein [Nitrospirota bacterium]